MQSEMNETRTFQSVNIRFFWDSWKGVKRIILIIGDI